MLLAIDVGNTNTVLGVFQHRDLIESWRVRAIRDYTADEYVILIKDLFHFSQLSHSDIKDVIISCVVPPALPALIEASLKYFGLRPLVVGPGLKTGVPIHYDNPREVGADRICNAVAAYDKYREALIVVDFGTATTLDYISAEGEYRGGVIAPGMTISLEALSVRAAKLPKIEIQKPKTVVGRNTVSSMQSGIVFGYVGLVDEIVNRIRAEVGTNPKVIATGGQADIIISESGTITAVEPFLTLQGLRIIYERNRG